MITISLCMIVKNEENTLERCLYSVRNIVDEIIIVDTGSIDKTKEIASKYTDKTYDFKWIDDFAAARNYSFSKATKDFILWLDADDVFLEEDRELFKSLKSDLTLQIDVVMMKYVLKRDESGNILNYFYRERLLKREKNFKWHDPIHEYIDFIGNMILHTEIAVTHEKVGTSSERNLRILKKLISTSTDVHPRHFFYYARESQDIGNLEEAENYYLKFLDMKEDVFSHYIESCIYLANIYINKNERKKALQSLIRSFEYGPMRAEVLCIIGHYYLEVKDYLTAIAWYELALSLKKPDITWDFILPEYWDFLPNLELCHCYYMLGNVNKALEHHNNTKQLKPYHEIVIKNEEFFNCISK
ncbi:Glycosyltransferase involved in cell wall bisynthesis [Clostridium cavendishii DSM 21758]|uniref:Glycosyltransferase involved in cell wall bisynthesis n=1 Tax=Clostridium cavendishii DSM 21758 TaxID=1121302 RepID=A0A1M6JIX0_9CLOT|nr:glycosyltransferase family 2 protein [Clostridium cavendishii]SHJ46626.1 Glycosyltransferase involved in cell wall bisynthesis [Clostridium cavendishii DSM 21758]